MPDVLAAVYLHPLASRELRVAAVVRAEEAGGMRAGLVRRLLATAQQRGRDEPELLMPALESHDPELLHAVLRRINHTLPIDRRIAAYARLAAAAGPEPVWALELQRAGSLERMHEAVRDSMAAHSDVPLQEAAVGTEQPRPERVTQAWDAAFQPTRPDTADRVRVHLDGRPDRWLRLREPGATLHGLLTVLDGAMPTPTPTPTPTSSPAADAPPPDARAPGPSPTTPPSHTPRPRLDPNPVPLASLVDLKPGLEPVADPTAGKSDPA